MTTVWLAFFILGILLFSAVVLTLLPDRCYGRGWYKEPSTVFGGIILVTIVLALFVPHA